MKRANGQQYTIRLSKTSETTLARPRDAQNSTLNFNQSTTVLSAQLRAVAADRREIGGGEGVRTPDLRLAKPALCQTELRPL